MSRCLLLLVLAGCSSNELKLVPTVGVVTLEGSPVENVRVVFRPLDDGNKVGGSAITDSNGGYLIHALIPGAMEDAPGLPPGKYRVVVIPADAIAETIGSERAAGMPSLSRTANVVPTVYQSDRSPIIKTVSESGETIDIKLQEDAS